MQRSLFRRHFAAVVTTAGLACALLMTSEARASFLSLDFGAAGFGQAGFQNVTPSTSVATASFPFTTPSDVTSGTTTVGLTSSAGNFRVIDRGTAANNLPAGGAFNNLYRDAVLPNDGATLTIGITGLNASTSYQLDLYSYDAQPVVRQETFTVTGGTLTGGTPTPSGNAVTFTANTVPNNQYDDAARLTVTSTAAGSITVVQSSTSTVPFLNGLEISAVPEPTSLGLLGVGGLGLLARRRRRA